MLDFRRTLGLVGSVVPASVVAVTLFLALYSWPAIRFNGAGFFVRMTWNLGNLYSDPRTVAGVSVLPGASYGLVFVLAGTLLTTAIAMLVAVPIGVGAAVFLAEGMRPSVLRTALSFIVELLAAIPSVVFGLWGFAVLIPILSRVVFPAMAWALGWIPFFGPPFGNGYGLLTSGLLLSLMVVPLITATLRDAIASQPASLREAAMAVGATRFETVWKVVLPGLRPVLIGAAVLATGRALGETMAVLMVSGNAANLPHRIYAPLSTMAAFIASQLDSALQDPTGLAVKSLAEVALVLCLLAVAVNTAARLVLAQFEPTRRAG